MSLDQQKQNLQENSSATDPDYVPHEPGMEDFGDLSMEIEEEHGTAVQPEKDNPENDPDPEDPDDPDADGSDTESDASDDSVFMFGDDKIKPDEPTQETEREKALRVELEQLRGKQQENQPVPENLPELKEPDLYDEGIGGDQQKYDAAMREYYKEQGKREALAEREQQEQETRRRAEHARIQENVKIYGQRMAQAKNTLPDIEAADEMLGRELPQLHQTALFSADVENPELVAYALYKNKELREKFKSEQNPFRLGMMIADISKKARLAPKGQPKSLNKEPKPKGSQGAHPNKHGLSGELASAVIE
jgi:hypothetical protein